jgi:hypothetical protein
LVLGIGLKGSKVLRQVVISIHPALQYRSQSSACVSSRDHPAWQWPSALHLTHQCQCVFPLGRHLHHGRLFSLHESEGGTSPRGTADGEIIHADIKGPVSPSVDGNIYYLGIDADYAKVRQAIPVLIKDAVFLQLQLFIARLERQSAIKVETV